MEFAFQNFKAEYLRYENIHYLLQIAIQAAGNIQLRHDAQNVYDEYSNVDVKMRLAFGISEIRLNNRFVSEKKGELKECHLLYYKLADLWFAYESYLKLFEMINGSGKDKIVWLNKQTYETYSMYSGISFALDQASADFTHSYGRVATRKMLIDYLNYSLGQAKGAQTTRINDLIARIPVQPFALTHSDVLTITYAVRNNFVHNGETTVVPEDFTYADKVRLLRILYPYLCLVLLSSINITCEMFIDQQGEKNRQLGL